MRAAAIILGDCVGALIIMNVGLVLIWIGIKELGIWRARRRLQRATAKALHPAALDMTSFAMQLTDTRIPELNQLFNDTAKENR